VTSGEQGKLEGQEYEYGRRLMTGEANAAINGAFDAGATEVVVADSHGHMRNMIPEDLHEGALLVRGSPRPMLMVEGIDDTFDAAIFVGSHSGAGNPLGVLAHSYIGSAIYSLKINGIELSEPTLNAAFIGHYGVPVVLVCGDDTVDAEVARMMPWCDRVITKWAISPMAAKNLNPKASQKKIREATKGALGRIKEAKPLVFDKPLNFEVTFMRAMSAYLASDVPGVERHGGRICTYQAKDMIDLARTWRLMINASIGQFVV
jgi:D-amino peptidase